uniref:Secreted frizzled-related protein 1 n=1 Tax=Callithrix jacchus TaxID=9483 RepID=A0A2R8PD62_CALJA
MGGNRIIAVFRTPFAPWLQFHWRTPSSAWLLTILLHSSRQRAGTTVCPPCDNELKSEAIIEHLCASEFALRMKIKEVKKENGDKKIVPKKKKPLKLGPIKKKDLKKLVLYLKNGADCPCHQLDNLSHHFLIMGRKVKSQYLLTAIHKWDKKNKEFKNFMKKMKNHECPTFQSVFK